MRVKWINELKDPATGRFLPHLLPVDPTSTGPTRLAAWKAATAGPRSLAIARPAPTRARRRLVTHLHGMVGVAQESDGYPEAWFLPAASDIPEGYAETGTFYDYHQGTSPLGDLWERGAAVFEYPNDQRAATLWYHDHTLGITRLNVYAGPAGFYLLRGGPGDLRARRAPRPGAAAGPPPWMRAVRDPDRDPGPLLQRRRVALLPEDTRAPPELANLYVPNGRLPADLGPGVLRRGHRRQRPAVALPRGRAAALPLPHPERQRLAVLDPEDG